jgi:diguanylate cyclase (GGDEF)-like protein
MKQNKLIVLFSIIMFFALLFSTLTSLFTIRKMSREHTEELLSTLTADIEHCIDSELVTVVNVSKTIANDTLLIDLLENEEGVGSNAIESRLVDYTDRLETTFSYAWVFIASDKSKAYYADTGIYRILDPDTEEDSWYREFVDAGEEYYVSIGRDNDEPDVWSIFTDVRIVNDEGKFLGVCGISLYLDELQEQIRHYEQEYGVEVLFVNEDGEVQLKSGDLSDSKILEDFHPSEISGEGLVVNRQGLSSDYTITKYLDQLGWYMIINDYDPFVQSGNLYLIIFNCLSFFVLILITFLCLRYMLKRNQMLFAFSYGDEMTGLYNRRAYENHLEQLRKRDSLDDVTMIVFDVNGLKKTNDTIGHHAGDELIKGMAHAIREVFASCGKCYRIGGDEFVAIIETEIPDIRVLTDRLDEVVSKRRGAFGEELSVSYGVVRGAKKPGMTVDELIASADEKMYHQKRKYYKKNGKNRRRE